MAFTSLAAPLSRGHTLLSLLIATAMAAVVSTALLFEYVGGYMPCKLCLEERVPYYIGVPLMLVAAGTSLVNLPSWLTRSLLIGGGLLMSYGLALSIFHAGVEWKFWLGPPDCGTGATSITTNAGNLLSDLNAIRPPTCDEAAGRFLGISFAGWNGVASLILAALCFYAAQFKTSIIR